MSRQIDLKDGTSITRAWNGDGFRFEVWNGSTCIIMEPTPEECDDLSTLFSDTAERHREIDP